MKNSDWKDRLNVVYSTNPDYNYEMDDDEEQVTWNRHNRTYGCNWIGKTGAAKS